MQIPATTSRVPENTAAYINERIRQGIANRLDYYARHPEEIDLRLKELDQEWDIERTLEANAAAFGLAGLVWRL